MQMTISGHHVEVTDSLREYVETKLAKVERHYDKITQASVILTVEKHERKAEITLYVAGDKLFASAVDDEDMYKAIDLLSDKIDKQVRRRKDKMSRHHTDKHVELEAPN